MCVGPGLMQITMFERARRMAKEIAMERGIFDDFILTIIITIIIIIIIIISFCCLVSNKNKNI